MFTAVVRFMRDDLCGGGGGEHVRYVFHTRCTQGENTYIMR